MQPSRPARPAHSARPSQPAAITLALAILLSTQLHQQAPANPPAANPPAATQRASTQPASTQPATTQPALTEEQRFAEAKDLLFRGRFEQAGTQFQQLAADFPSKTAYRFYLARVQLYQQQPDAAAKLLESVLADAPDQSDAGLLLAEILAARGEHERLLTVLTPMLAYRNDYATFHLLAEAAYRTGDLATARGHYLKAIEQNPASPQDHYQLANIYLSQSLYALAAERFESALELGMAGRLLHYKLASTYFNLRNYFGQTRVMTVRGGKPGTFADGWYLLEVLHAADERFRAAPQRSAIFHVARAIQLSEQPSPDLQFLHANILLNGRRFEQAYQIFASLEKTIPDEDRALYCYYFSQAAFGVGKYDEYLARLRRAIEIDRTTYEPSLVDAYIRVAEQHNQRGEYEAYIACLLQAVDISPQSASLQLRLANALEQAGRLPEAAMRWRMVLDLEPDHPDRLDLLNRIRRQSP